MGLLAFFFFLLATVVGKRDIFLSPQEGGRIEKENNSFNADECMCCVPYILILPLKAMLQI